MPFHDIIGHQATVASLQRAVAQQRLAHAYLFHGEAAIGKRTTALCFSQALNCETNVPGEMIDACGVCRSCRQIESRTHPDFFVIEPDSEATTPQIKIEQVREIDQQIMYRPLIGERKICLIDKADCMTIGAANALLKTLEEPPDHSLFLVVTSRPAALPATIRSRCQSIRFATPARTQVEAALILRRELPPVDARLLAIVTESRIGEALSTDANEVRARQQELLELVRPQSLQSTTVLLAAAEALAKADRASEILESLSRWIRDILIVQVGGDCDQLTYLNEHSGTDTYARLARTDSLLDLLQDIEKIQQQATRHLNLHMALENVLLRLREALGLVPVGASA